MLIYRNNKKRCMKKLLVVLAVLFIGILIAGCTSQPAAPVTTPVPTAVPTVIVTTAPPTPVVTKETVVVVVNKTANVTATPTPTPTPVPTYTITFTQDLTIIPDTNAYIKVGTKVIWLNMDSLKPHGVQATDATTGQYFGGMGPLEIPYGQTLEVTFDKVGSYDYTTGPFQPQTSGKIVVTA
jgi:plastocyanin